MNPLTISYTVKFPYAEYNVSGYEFTAFGIVLHFTDGGTQAFNAPESMNGVVSWVTILPYAGVQ